MALCGQTTWHAPHPTHFPGSMRGDEIAPASMAPYGQTKTHLSQPTHSWPVHTAFLEYLTTCTASSGYPSCRSTALLRSSLLVSIRVPSFMRQKPSWHWIDTMFLIPEARALKMRSVGTRPAHGTRMGTYPLTSRPWSARISSTSPLLGELPRHIMTSVSAPGQAARTCSRRPAWS